MELLKLIKNRISSEWKKTFNDNVDILNRNAHDQDQKLDTTNSRIDNLVLHSGSESPNEVVDARVNNKAVTFSTLAARLLDTENTHDSDVEQLGLTQANQQLQLEQLNNGIGKLMGTYGATLDLYVSATNGDDKNGNGSEEKPFKTIQMAVNMIPLISTAANTIWIDEGVYLEDVSISRMISDITIKAIKDPGDVDRSVTDLSVKVRSIAFYACSGYYLVQNIQIVDSANAPVFNDKKYGFLIDQGGYLSMGGYKAIEDTKSFNFNLVYVGGGSTCHMWGADYVANQKIVLRSEKLANTMVSGSRGKDNETGFLAQIGGIISHNVTSTTYAKNLSVTGGPGLIITKGTVM
ncbi:hypothetical protein ACFFH2_04140 [Enterococcus devriesei]|uniref:Uncharacterized protein n=1 Tax=Enterococcus devriesei TaxID=319970 RepID=A0A1L8SNR0_9ENTE|nr:hypothetical protein [Enterococcus devriesei]OJG33494.1 hypothetical protein RV00_GL001050 [Enterococcus devriesei]